MLAMSKQVLLYYKFISVLDPTAAVAEQRQICQKLGLLGRILIGQEGINGTVSGDTAATEAYMQFMADHALFGGIDFKVDPSETVPFRKLRVKARDEVVTLGVAADPRNGATKVTPAELNIMLKDPEVVIFDTRNSYESAIGRFKGSVTPDISLFSELPGVLDQYQDIKDKKVVTVCTGGIRCEKVTSVMKEAGFSDLYQLDGGMVKYAQKYPDGAFEGDLFVFDERMAVRYSSTPQLLGSCVVCEAKTNDYHNCAHKPCNKLSLICSDCWNPDRTCSAACQTQVEALVNA